jgi:hypothetical protein
LDEHVEAPKLIADARRRGGDRILIGHVELECVGIRANPLGRGFAALQIARPDQYNESVCYEILCNLKADSLIRPSDQCDEFVLHGNFLFIDEQPRPRIRVPSGR